MCLGPVLMAVVVVKKKKKKQGPRRVSPRPCACIGKLVVVKKEKNRAQDVSQALCS